MSRKLIMLVSLGVWFANYVACFSCTDHLANQSKVLEFSNPTIENLSTSEPENPKEGIPADCHCVCGLGTFTFVAHSFPVLADLPTLPLFAVNSDLAEQTRTDSIFRPPQA